MKKILQSILGILFIFTGIVLILNSFSGITGFVVFENISKNTGSIFGIVFIVVGALLFVIRGEEQRKYRAEELLRAYESGRIGPIKAASEINAIYPIDGVKFTPNSRNSVVSPDGVHPLSLKHGKKAKELALGLYEVAVHNDPRNKSRCELHLGKTASTKHHKKGFEKEVSKFEDQHRSELADLMKD